MNAITPTTASDARAVNSLMSVAAVSELIAGGAQLSLAGPESALDQLPRGNWIAGTIPYFMLAQGGTVVTEGAVFVTDLTGLGEVSIASYSASELSRIAPNGPDNGFALVIIPAESSCHRIYAEEAADYQDAFVKPTVGWIAGVHLSDLGKVTPKVYDGRTATKYEDRAVVAYVELPADRLASVEIVNLFEQGDGDVLTFPNAGSQVSGCKVNGKPAVFADYIAEHNLAGGRLPLVADYAGAQINVSLQTVDQFEGKVGLYAPVFPGIEYRFAKPVSDYAALFREKLGKQDKQGAVLACNCILNFVFGELEGKAIGGVEGPVTFGEIAYQLLNQTAVLVRIV